MPMNFLRKVSGNIRSFTTHWYIGSIRILDRGVEYVWLLLARTCRGEGRGEGWGDLAGGGGGDDGGKRARGKIAGRVLGISSSRYAGLAR